LFTFVKILRHMIDGVISSPIEGVPQTFVALKSPSPSVGFASANLGFSGKHANHYTTEATALRTYATLLLH
jgi:hypothetical protein